MILVDDIERIVSDAAYRDDMRHRFITDHAVAAEIMGLPPFHPILHEPVRRLHIRKNPSMPIELQSEKKKRLHLDPRFTYKTTFNRVDKVQWIAAFPALITILNQSSTQPLAMKIAKTQANYFYCPKYQQPTRLQACFPELVTDKPPFSNNTDKWSTPSHDAINAMDDTIAFTSPQSSQSGWHPWILNCDDMVDTKNSGLKALEHIYALCLGRAAQRRLSASCGSDGPLCVLSIRQRGRANDTLRRRIDDLDSFVSLHGREYAIDVGLIEVAHVFALGFGWYEHTLGRLDCFENTVKTI